jgi:hypothetical protein
MEHIMSIQNHLLAIGLRARCTLAGAVSASAGPLPIGNSGLTTAAAPATTEIRLARAAGVRASGSASPPAH